VTEDVPPTNEDDLAKWCKRKYEKEEFTIRDVADALGCSYAEADRLLRKAGTKKRPPGARPVKADPAVSKAYKRGNSAAAVAAKRGLSAGAVLRRLHRDPDVTIRRHGPALKPPPPADPAGKDQSAS